MIKFLFILLILILVGCLAALRYRKQIQMAMYVLRMFRKMRQMEKSDRGQIETKAILPDNSALVQCAGCRNWTTENKALKMGSKSFFCSAVCMERSAKVSV